MPKKLCQNGHLLSSITLAELSQGPHMATSADERIRRSELLQVVESRFPVPLAFDAPSARRYGSLVATVAAAGRSSKPRRIDLMIAATASVIGVPLFTRNAGDLAGLSEFVEVIAV